MVLQPTRGSHCAFLKTLQFFTISLRVKVHITTESHRVSPWTFPLWLIVLQQYQAHYFSHFKAYALAVLWNTAPPDSVMTHFFPSDVILSKSPLTTPHKIIIILFIPSIPSCPAFV